MPAVKPRSFALGTERVNTKEKNKNRKYVSLSELFKSFAANSVIEVTAR